MLDTSKTFHAAVYLRLSREDGDVTDGSKQVSNSIANQRMTALAVSISRDRNSKECSLISERVRLIASL